MDDLNSKRDFFISYNKADRNWAGWVAWELEEEGYTTVLQDWDFRPGQNFVIRMNQAAKQAERTISILSPDYLSSDYVQPEWAAAFGQDPTGNKGLFVPVRVRECAVEGLLPQVIYTDLVGLEEQTAKERLLNGVRRGRAKPIKKPPFPIASPRSVTQRPSFPGYKKPHRRSLLWKLIFATAALLTVFLVSNSLINYLSSAGRTQRSGGSAVSSARNKIVLVFCDVTSSLSESEADKVASLAADILDSLPKNSRYAVYSIGKYTGDIPPLIPSSIADEDVIRNANPVKRIQRREGLRSQIGSLYKEHNEGNNQSCILNALPFAKERLTRMMYFDQEATSEPEPEIFFISDMVENCYETPVGPIKMSNSDDWVLIHQVAKRFPCTTSLSGVRITVIIPSTFTSQYSTTRKPPRDYVKGFWRTIFMQCGFKEEWFWDQEHIDWIPNGELPDRLNKSN